MYKKDKYNNILGGLIGLACGDSLGATLEFLPPHSRKNTLTEIIGGGQLHWKPGEPTDDTEMTIAVAKGILKNPNEPIKEIGEEFIKWYKTNPKDMGVTIRLSIINAKFYGSWRKGAIETDLELGQSAGNGSLMRTLPVALYYDDLDKVKQLSQEQSDLTHYDDLAGECCVIYNTIIHMILNSQGAKWKIKKYINTFPNLKDCWNTARVTLNPSGYVLDSFKCALWCFLNSHSFENAVVKAANLCGDSDTIAAITGGLAGVYYGYNSIPYRWKSKLLAKERLINIANRFVEQE